MNLIVSAHNTLRITNLNSQFKATEIYLSHGTLINFHTCLRAVNFLRIQCKMLCRGSNALFFNSFDHMTGNLTGQNRIF